MNSTAYDRATLGGASSVTLGLWESAVLSPVRLDAPPSVAQSKSSTLDSLVDHKRENLTRTVPASDISQGDAAWESSLRDSHELLEKMYDDALEQYLAGGTVEIGNNPCVHVAR